MFGTVSARALGVILEHFASRGADLDVILPPARRRGLDLDDPDARIPVTRLRGLWARASAALSDPHVGLSVARTVEASTFGVFSYLAVTSPSWGEAVANVCRFQRLMESSASYRLVRGEDHAAYEVAPPPMPGSDRRHLVEFSVGVAFEYSRRHVAAEWRPRDVYFRHDPPPDPKPAEAFFGAPVRYRARANGYAFDPALLQAPLRAADPALSATLAAHAAELLTRVPSETDVVAATRAHVARALPGGDPSLEAVAALMATTPRTLQRRLRARGTSHRALVAEVRRAAAEDLLSNSALSLTEVAFLLGFSELAAFHRAFRRWTGQTPGGFREARRREP